MCSRCERFHYEIENGTLTKTASYQTNHLRVMGGWSIDKILFDKHRRARDFDRIRIIETDAQRRTWSVDLRSFEANRIVRLDSKGEEQYFLADKFWRVDYPGRSEAERPSAPPTPVQRKLF